MSKDTPRTDAERPQNMGVNRDFARQLERELALNAAMLARQCDLARQAEQERDAMLRPLAEAHERFKHLDGLLEDIAGEDSPFHMTARDLWRAIKASIGARATP
jgi:hypothetical protein